DSVAAVRLGLVGGAELHDLDDVEDKDAEVDYNGVMPGRGQFVEVQGSGEEATFSPEQLTSLIALARAGLREVSAAQTEFLARRLL
ncbi:MAG: ribonuclease PH, partial [Opitutaceae bacterium]